MINQQLFEPTFKHVIVKLRIPITLVYVGWSSFMRPLGSGVPVNSVVEALRRVLGNMQG